MRKAVAGKTMVGEYVGNPEFQHLVKYSKTEILFYALVDNSSAATCLPPQEAFNLFRKFKLSAVSVQDLGSFTNFTELGKALKLAFDKVAESAVSEEEEGSVLYLVHQAPSGAQRTLALCKLKTLEYRVLRKLKEKLRNFVKNHKNAASVLKKFISETKSLVTGR